MRVPKKAKPHAGGRGASRSAPTEQLRSNGDTRTKPDRLLVVALAGLQCARSALAACAVRTDEPAFGVIEASDAVDLAEGALAAYLSGRYAP